MVYSGLVPISPNTTPIAPSISAPKLALPPWSGWEVAVFPVAEFMWFS